jgi:XRE family transcriptional regulator, regulator of sulfur utilization
MARAPKRRPEAAPAAAQAEGGGDLTELVAARVRALRRERGYSLEDVAALSGVSRATLSQIETNKTNPTIGILWKIASGFGVPFSTLLAESSSQAIQVIRHGSQGTIRSDDGSFESRPLSPARALGNIELYELTLNPRSQHASPAHPPGTTEAAIVLSGVLRIGVGDSRADAGAGDSIYFRADEPHVYENPGRVVTRFVNVIVYGSARPAV